MTALRSFSLVAVAAIAAASLAGCQLHGRPHVRRVERPGIQAVPEAAAAEATADSAVMRLVVAPGIVEPWGDQVELSAKEAGWISAILVREGEAVRPGQLVATLDSEGQRRAIDLARSELAEAVAAMDRIERGPTAEEIEQARSDLAATVARRDFAAATAERTRKLRESGAVAEVENDRSLSDARVESALAERAAARLRELQRGARPEDRAAARARVAAARARLSLAEAGLQRREVVAPRAGTILLSRFHAGEYYSPEAGPLFALGDVSRLQVRLEVDEIDALDVRVGGRCDLYSDGGVRLGEGVVTRLAPRMGRRSLPLESPTARTDVRIREVFVELPSTVRLVPGQRVWGRTPRHKPGEAS